MDKSLSTMNPEVAKEWHPSKNGSLTPSEISYGSKKFVWWLGTCGHEWQAKPNARSISSRKRTGCPYCSGNKVLKGFNDLESKYPDIAKEWHPTKNDLLPSEVSYGSGYSSWWLSNCGHEWQSKVGTRAKNNVTCTVCMNQKVLKGFNDLESKYPDIAKEWHTLKNGLPASEVVFKSGRKAWWICNKGHEWETQVRVRTNGKSGCSVCNNKLVLKDFNDLSLTHSNIAKEWHPTLNSKTTQEVMAGSPQKAWWLGACGHEWQSPIRNRALNGKGCLVCCNQKVLKGYNDLESKYPDIAKEWHYALNSTTPDNIVSGSNTKAWWQCSNDEEHIWFSAPSGRTGNRKRGCPTCNNGGFNPNRESILYFIHNPKLECYKIGISHPNSKRMENWNKTGWTLIHEVSHTSGHNIANLETLMFRWIRKELKLPVALKMWETGSYGGFSETFAMDIEELEVVEKIDSTWESILLTSPETYAS